MFAVCLPLAAGADPPTTPSGFGPFHFDPLAMYNNATWLGSLARRPYGPEFLVVEPSTNSPPAPEAPRTRWIGYNHMPYPAYHHTNLPQDPSEIIRRMNTLQCLVVQADAIASLGRLTQLQRLEMMGCNVTAAAGLSGLVRLTCLVALGNSFDAEGIRALGCMRKLAVARVGLHARGFATDPDAAGAFLALEGATALRHLEIVRATGPPEYHYSFTAVSRNGVDQLKVHTSFPCAQLRNSSSYDRYPHAKDGCPVGELAFLSSMQHLQHLVLPIAADMQSTGRNLAAAFQQYLGGNRPQQLTCLSFSSTTFLDASGLAGVSAFPCTQQLDLTHAPELVSPASLAHLQHIAGSLTALCLSHNRLSHQSSTRAGGTRCATSTKLRANPLKCLKVLSQLQHLELDDCGISNALVLSKLTQLTYLGAAGNSLDVNSMMGLGKLTNLATLDLQYGLARQAATTPTVCQAFSALTGLTFLRASIGHQKRLVIDSSSPLSDVNKGSQQFSNCGSRPPSYLCQFKTCTSDDGSRCLAANLCGPKKHVRKGSTHSNPGGLCCCSSQHSSSSASAGLSQLNKLQHLLLPLDGLCPVHDTPSLSSAMQQLSVLSHLRLTCRQRHPNFMAVGAAAFAAQPGQQHGQLQLQGQAGMMRLTGCGAYLSAVTALTCLAHTPLIVTVKRTAAWNSTAASVAIGGVPAADAPSGGDSQKVVESAGSSSESDSDIASEASTVISEDEADACNAMAANAHHTAEDGDSVVWERQFSGHYVTLYSSKHRVACVDTGTEEVGTLDNDVPDARQRSDAGSVIMTGRVPANGPWDGMGTQPVVHSSQSQQTTAFDSTRTGLPVGLGWLLSLKRLDISNCGAVSMAGIKELTGLTYLRAPYNKFMDTEVAEVVENLKLLEYLDLSRSLCSSWNVRAEQQLLGALLQLPCLAYLDVSKYDLSGLASSMRDLSAGTTAAGSTATGTLQVLRLIGCNLGDWGLKEVLSSFSSSNLKELNVSCNAVTAAGLALLAPMCPKLNKLSAADLQEPVHTAIVAVPVATIAHLPWLAVYLTQLQQLDLGGNGFGSSTEVDTALVRMLGAMSSLKEINLTGNGLSRAAESQLSAIAAARHCKLLLEWHDIVHSMGGVSTPDGISSDAACQQQQGDSDDSKLQVLNVCVAAATAVDSTAGAAAVDAVMESEGEAENPWVSVPWSCAPVGRYYAMRERGHHLMARQH